MWLTVAVGDTIADESGHTKRKSLGMLLGSIVAKQLWPHATADCKFDECKCSAAAAAW